MRRREVVSTRRWFRRRGALCLLIAASFLLSFPLMTRVARAASGWTNLAPPASPYPVFFSPYGEAVMTFDTTSLVSILYGGDVGTATFDGTWSYNYTADRWTDMRPSPAPPPRSREAIAFDSESGKAILFGGWLCLGAPCSSGGSLSNETWAYDYPTNRWTDMMPTVRPSPRAGMGMAYDSKADRLVLFGGCAGNVSLCTPQDDTWTYDFNSNLWTNVTAGTKPFPPRIVDAMAYDASVDRVILFGGAGNQDPRIYNDTWAYDLGNNTWTFMAARGSPITIQAMAYDASARRMIAVGENLVNSDTYALDAGTGTWSILGYAPLSFNLVAGMTYDVGADRVIALGAGLETAPTYNSASTWAYEYRTNRWSARRCSMPPPQDSPPMVYDPRADRVIFADPGASWLYTWPKTWTYDRGRNVWTSMNPPDSPIPWRTSIAYDASADRVVLFGGGDGFPGPRGSNVTEVYDLGTNAWTTRQPAQSPPARGGHAMVYDARADRLVMFGGWASGRCDMNGCELTDLGDTWTYDYAGNAWTNQSPPAGPNPRSEASMAYDSDAGRIVLFGGETVGITGTIFGDTWTYDLQANVWANVSGPGSPPARSGAGIAYDERVHRMILFGGRGETQRLNDTWEYDIWTNTWTNVTSPGGPPSGRFAPSMVYDSVTGETIMFGGAGAETWAYQASASPIDTTPPTIAITSPSDGALLAARSVVVSGTAVDNVAVRKVVLSTDGNTWGLASGTSTWFGTLSLSEGPNTIYARAVDLQGNNATTSIIVTVSTVGAIRGAVRDTGGSPIEGAVVHLLNGTDEVSNASTDATGMYAFANLAAPGTYTIRVEKAGFESATEVVTVVAGQTATGDVTLVPVAPVSSAFPLAGLGLVVIVTAAVVLALAIRRRRKRTENTEPQGTDEKE